jgi:hypothetical protein
MVGSYGAVVGDAVPISYLHMQIGCSGARVKVK